MNRVTLVAGLLVGLTRLISGVQARWLGSQPVARQRLYYANHSSHLDALVIWSALPPELRRVTRPVAAADYWERGSLRPFLAREVLGAVLIDRRNGVGAREALARIDAALHEGQSLILFPEGTRGDGVTLGSFKPGLFHIARSHPEVELVPVYLQNLNRILPKGDFLPVPLLGSATFGPALPVEPGETRQAFLERARTALLNLEASR
jgi:1-acyl-sn-glycerol-3-phosphate acyltransferase